MAKWRRLAAVWAACGTCAVSETQLMSLGFLCCGADTSAVSNSLLGSSVTKWVDGRGAIAALRSDGSVVTWGGEYVGGNSSSVAQNLTHGVVDVYSNKWAMVALKQDGGVIVWGDPWSGGNMTALPVFVSSGVRKLFWNQGAWAALMQDTGVFTWGDVYSGGNADSVQNLLQHVVTVVPADYAFAALKSDGTVVAWGDPWFGGNASGVQAQLTNVKAIYSTNWAFAAVKNDGTVVTWGDSYCGGDSSAVQASLQNVKLVVGNDNCAFAALTTSGSVVAWGLSWTGGSIPAATQAKLTSGVQSLYANCHSFVALKTDGSVVVWGSWWSGGNSSAVDSQLQGGVTDIFQTEYANDCWGHEFGGSAWAALKNGTGQVVTWGHPKRGGNSSSVSAFLQSGVQEVRPNAYGFAARKGGSVVAWGYPDHGGNTSAVDQYLADSVVGLYNFSQGFAALKSNGQLVVWGEGYAPGRASTNQTGLLNIYVHSIVGTWSALIIIYDEGSPIDVLTRHKMAAGIILLLIILGIAAVVAALWCYKKKTEQRAPTFRDYDSEHEMEMRYARA